LFASDRIEKAARCGLHRAQAVEVHDVGRHRREQRGKDPDADPDHDEREHRPLEIAGASQRVAWLRGDRGAHAHQPRFAFSAAVRDDVPERDAREIRE
jgi:hypothetical protein